MTRKEALIELRDKVAAGDASTMRFEDVFGGDCDGFSYIAELAYFGSLDAALALHNAVLPDQGWQVEWVAKYPSLAFKPAAYCASVGWGTRHAAYSETPARALLLAILSAMIAECEE